MTALTSPSQARTWLPRSFYARAAMILILPILVIQLVVAVLFLQRHFEDVTDQMTANMTRELALVRDRPELSEALGLTWVDPPDRTRIAWFDLSGRAMLARMEQAIPDLEALDLRTGDKQVRVGFADGTGLAFARGEVTASNPHQLLVWMVFVALVMTGISMLFLRGQIRPIRRLARAAEAFGKGQTLPFRPTGATEVRSAGTAFLDMRTRIERHIEQRTLLLSGVSHDLRTPLTRMKLELSMMDGEEASSLRDDVAAMERIIDTFLDFARGDATAATEVVDLTDLVRDAVGQALPNRDVAVGGHPVTVRVATTALRRAVQNLVTNAARYGERIVVSVHGSEHACIVAVEDDGPGIAEDDRDAATRPFARLDRARSNTRGNVGLGLAIVQDVARAHGGTLRLGTSEMGGLKAEIVLPR
ncbi:ATP-binding protein [Jannaschia sp. LMIT008]|uniref:ATP-binding protein n=1 Tax=Jannaschia maritima TaxID=3032585 RepID=UPI00281266BA|nr:ATP-binding protein [Jannaschia sp. LMIT008]